MSECEVVTIDGSVFEGGGQILRIATSLSAITGIPVHINKIRAGRPKPGLMAQHFVALNLMTKMCHAKISGAEIGSTEITFYPGDWIEPGSYEIDCQTAAALSLVIQSIVPALLYSGARNGTTIVDMRGGTNVAFSPQIETLCMSLFPLLNHCVADGLLDYKIDMRLRGCYPQGGGRILFKMNHPLTSFPRPPIELLDRGKITSTEICSWHSGRAPFRAAKRMAESAERELCQFGVLPKVQVTSAPPSGSYSSGAGISVSLKTDTGCILCADYILPKNKDGNSVGHLLFDELNHRTACVDNHTQDQLIIFMALAAGKSSIRCLYPLTNHTLAAIHVVDKILGVKFTVNGPDEDDNTCVLSCEGIGWTPAMTKFEKL